jgi:Flp pilus assembly pilin Flp
VASHVPPVSSPHLAIRALADHDSARRRTTLCAPPRRAVAPTARWIACALLAPARRDAAHDELEACTRMLCAKDSYSVLRNSAPETARARLSDCNTNHLSVMSLREIHARPGTCCVAGHAAGAAFTKEEDRWFASHISFIRWSARMKAEYALLVGLIALVAVTAVTTAGANVNTIFTNIATALGKAVGGS